MTMMQGKAIASAVTPMTAIEYLAALALPDPSSFDTRTLLKGKENIHHQ